MSNNLIFFVFFISCLRSSYRVVRGRSVTCFEASPSSTVKSWWKMAACSFVRLDTWFWQVVPRSVSHWLLIRINSGFCWPVTTPWVVESILWSLSSRVIIQPRDVTNFTVGGFAPMSPRISSPMHHGGGGGPEIFLFVNVEKSTVALKCLGLCCRGSSKRGWRRRRNVAWKGTPGQWADWSDGPHLSGSLQRSDCDRNHSHMTSCPLQP